MTEVCSRFRRPRMSWSQGVINQVDLVLGGIHERDAIGPFRRQHTKTGLRRVSLSHRPIRVGLVIMCIMPLLVAGQYKEQSALFEEKMEIAETELTATLKGGEYVEDTLSLESQVMSLGCG